MKVTGESEHVAEIIIACHFAFWHQNKKAEKELMRTEERIKNLGEVLDKKEAEYKDYKEREIESIKVLEASVIKKKKSQGV